MKNLAAILILFIIAGCGSVELDSIKGGEKENKTYLLIGGANIAGLASIGDYTEVIEDAYLLYINEEFVPAQNPINIHSNLRDPKDIMGLSLGYSFAEKMVGIENVQLVSNGVEGKDISCWVPGGRCYSKTLDRVGGIKIDAILFHHGDTDKFNLSYTTELVYMIESYRSELGEGIPVIVGQLVQWDEDNDDFNDNILTLPNFVENVFVVTTEGLTGCPVGDNSCGGGEFNVPSMIELGIRYANAIIAIEH